MAPQRAPILDVGGDKYIDVRGLPPPEPMIEIVGLIDRMEAGGEGGSIIAELDREPIYLYPELDERGWAYEIIPGETGEVRLRLTRTA